jgi:hypothetical protein
MKPTQEQIEQAKAILEQANICAIYWGVDDVKGRAKELDVLLTNEQAIKIIKDIERQHDANYGVTWETIDCHVRINGLNLFEIDNLDVMFNILEKHNISITTCENEFEGEENDEFDTYQLSYENEEDYFGEFVFDKVSDEITYRRYEEEN